MRHSTGLNSPAADASDHRTPIEAIGLLVEVVEETLLQVVVVSGSVRAEQRPHLRSPDESSIPQLDAL
jgi:hypothetical protein